MIISQLSQHPVSKQHDMRVKNGTSFAERLEMGNSARQVTQERALGFAETGLLGIHYAHDLSKNTAGDDTAKCFNADKALTESNDVLDIFSSVASITPIKDKNIGILRQLPNKPTIMGAQSRLNKADHTLPPVYTGDEFLWPDLATSVDTSPQDIQKYLQKAIFNNRTETGLTLRIVENPHGVSIVCDDNIVADGTLDEFMELAHEIAKDFSVTVHRLVVNRNT